MSFTPSSEIRLLNVPLDSSYNNQLTFADTLSQTSYFLGRQVSIFDLNNYTYQRKDEVIRVNAHADMLWNVNYVMFKNDTMHNKWFYAFVNKVEYVNDSTTWLHIETDVHQTWLFDYTLKNCFVEREHCNYKDSVSVVENLDTGNEYVCREQEHLFNGSECYIMVMKDSVSNIMQGKEFDKQVPLPIAGTPTVVFQYLLTPEQLNVFNLYLSNVTSAEDRAGWEHINDAPPTAPIAPPDGDFWKNVKYQADMIAHNIAWQLWATNKALYEFNHSYISERNAKISNSIIKIFRCPFTPNITTIIDQFGMPLMMEMGDLVTEEIQSSITNNTFPEPKLNYFPFTYYNISTHKGTAQLIKPEYVNSGGLVIKRTVGITNGAKMRYEPMNYQGGINAKDLSIVDESNTSLSVLNDAYGSYMMGNRNQDTVSAISGMVGGIATVGFGLATSPVGGAIMASAGLAQVGASVAGKLAKQQDIKNVPPTVTGSNGNASFENADNENGVWVEKWTINDQHANILTGYFHKYGYQVNRFKIPDINSNTLFNYIKTGEVNIIGNLPNADMIKLKSIFNAGCTFWHDPAKVGDYE